MATIPLSPHFRAPSSARIFDYVLATLRDGRYKTPFDASVDIFFFPLHHAARFDPFS